MKDIGAIGCVESDYLRKEDGEMFQKFTDLYNTLYTFADAVITKWFKKENPAAEANGYITKIIDFLKESISTFIG